MSRVRWLPTWLGIMMLALAGTARAKDAAEPVPGLYDDTRRFYLYFETGASLLLDRHFAGDVEMDTPNGNLTLGGGLGYNLSRHWGIELQFQGTEPDLRSASRGKIDEISNITLVPAARFRWPLGDGRLVPYATGGVGISTTDVNDTAKRYVGANADTTTIVGSMSAGLDYFLTPNIAAGVEMRSLIYPDQDSEVTYFFPGSSRVSHVDDSFNQTSMQVLAHLRIYPGQAPGADGQGRRFLLADRGPFDTDERRVYLSGLFGYEFLFDRDAGAGVRLRDQGGDLNLTLGGALGVNLDRHWGVEVQLLVTDFNMNREPFQKLSELSDFVVLPTLRYRWPLYGGRLVPFATAGIGVAFPNIDDPRPVENVGGVALVPPAVRVDGPVVMGSVGAGVEYFLNRNFSVGMLFPVHLYQDMDIRVLQAGRPPEKGSANLSGFLAVLQLKVYVP